MEKNKVMKSVMMKMTILMGLTMSFVLSLVGTLLGGHFSIPGWIISFLVSLVISLIIGFVVPIKKVTDSACKKAGVEPASPKGNFLSALVSDLIYTPVITVIMVIVMINGAKRNIPEEVLAQGGGPSVARVLPISLIVCLIVGWIVIAVIQPVYIKYLTKNLGPGGPNGPGGPGGSGRPDGPGKPGGPEA